MTSILKFEVKVELMLKALPIMSLFTNETTLYGKTKFKDRLVLPFFTFSSDSHLINKRSVLSSISHKSMFNFDYNLISIFSMQSFIKKHIKLKSNLFQKKKNYKVSKKLQPIIRTLFLQYLILN